MWSAVLRLTGNPIKVLNRYLGQAHDLGFELGAKCVLFYLHGEIGANATVEEVAPNDTLRSRGLRWLRCNASGVARADDVNRAKELSIELRRSAVDVDVEYDDYILIRFARRPGGWPFGPSEDSLATLPAEWATGVPGPPEPPRVSTTGERIKRGDRFANRPINVGKGTRLLAPPGLPCPQRGGFDAVLEVRGDVDWVLDNYAAQFRKKAMRTERSTARFRGRKVTIDDGFGETGNYSAVAIDDDKGDAAYLHLWFCGTS